MKDYNDAYQFGVKTAEEVQAALAEGKSWEDDDVKGFPPERAMYVRDLYRNGGHEDFAVYWDGYLSRWD